MLFGFRFGSRIRTLEVIGVGQRLVRAFDVASGMHHAGCAGVDEPRDSLFPAGRNDIVGPDEVGESVGFVGPPHAGLASHVEDDVATRYCALHRLGVRQVAAQGLDARGGQLRVVAARETAHRIASLEQLGHYGLAKEAAAAGYQDLHPCVLPIRLLAQSASFSRPILAL